MSEMNKKQLMIKARRELKKEQRASGIDMNEWKHLPKTIRVPVAIDFPLDNLKIDHALKFEFIKKEIVKPWQKSDNAIYNNDFSGFKRVSLYKCRISQSLYDQVENPHLLEQSEMIRKKLRVVNVIINIEYDQLYITYTMYMTEMKYK